MSPWPMPTRPRKASPDPGRMALFLEEARAIVHKDRYLRKHRASVDTAGAIARACERAYKAGFVDAQVAAPTPPVEASGAENDLAWSRLPTLFRDTFLMICLAIHDKAPANPFAGYLVAVPNPRGRGRRWALRLPDGRNAPLFPNRAVLGLLRHGLLRQDDAYPSHLILGERGQFLWAARMPKL